MKEDKHDLTVKQTQIVVRAIPYLCNVYMERYGVLRLRLQGMLVHCKFHQNIVRFLNLTGALYMRKYPRPLHRHCENKVSVPGTL